MKLIYGEPTLAQRAYFSAGDVYAQKPLAGVRVQRGAVVTAWSYRDPHQALARGARAYIDAMEPLITGTGGYNDIVAEGWDGYGGYDIERVATKFLSWVEAARGIRPAASLASVHLRFVDRIEEIAEGGDGECHDDEGPCLRYAACDWLTGMLRVIDGFDPGWSIVPLWIREPYRGC